MIVISVDVYWTSHHHPTATITNFAVGLFSSWPLCASEAVLGVWRPAPLQTSRAPPYRARFGRWREERFGRASMFDLTV